VLNIENYQGNAGVNYTESEVPYTRIVEHKHFEFGKQKSTVITKEYSVSWIPGMEPFYPVNDKANNDKYYLYRDEANKNDKIIFGGRLAEYKYYDMHQIIASALSKVSKELNQNL
jgi:UDP-galactopyranose mutase